MAAFAHGWSLEAIENPAIQHPCRIIEHAFVFGLSILPNAGCTDPPCPKTRTPAHITAAKTTVKLADVCIAVAARNSLSDIARHAPIGDRLLVAQCPTCRLGPLHLAIRGFMEAHVNV